MKNFFKNLLINFAIVVIVANIVPAIFNGSWDSSVFILQLLLMMVVVRLGQLLTNLFTSKYRILEIGLELLMVMTVVLAFGWLFNWYTLAYIWMMPLMVVTVYIFAYILDIARTRKEIEFINTQLRRRKERLVATISEKDKCN